jgi:RNAse (barnase) inhibitor barstar
MPHLRIVFVDISENKNNIEDTFNKIVKFSDS